jgi:serine/threonine protein kinase
MHPAETAGTVVGRYHLLQKIGEGGMGEVWLAEQKEPVRRRVALKLIKAGMSSREVIARFESERQALALMDHPAIAKVLDAGSARPKGWHCSCASVKACSTRIRKPSSIAT